MPPNYHCNMRLNHLLARRNDQFFFDGVRMRIPVVVAALMFASAINIATSANSEADTVPWQVGSSTDGNVRGYRDLNIDDINISLLQNSVVYGVLSQPVIKKHTNVSSLCQEDMKKMLFAINNRELWAIKGKR